MCLWSQQVGVESYSCFLGWEPLKYFKLPILLGLTLDTSRIDEGRWLQETTVTKVPGITCLHRKVVSSPPCLASLLLPFHFPFLIDFIAPHSRYMLCHLDLQIQSQTMRLPDYVVSRGTLILWTVSLTRCMLWHWDSSQGAMSRSDLSDVRFSLNAGCAIRIYVIDFSRGWYDFSPTVVIWLLAGWCDLHKPDAGAMNVSPYFGQKMLVLHYLLFSRDSQLG